MKTRYQLLLAAIIVSPALASASGPAFAQQATAKWNPTLEQVIISAKASRNYRVVLTNSRLGEAFIVSASMEVPYNDLNLARDPDADELGRRLHEFDRRGFDTISPAERDARHSARALATRAEGAL